MKKYKRYNSKFQDERINSAERKLFEQNLIEEFTDLYSDKSKLNIKTARKLFEGLLDSIGEILQKFARQVAEHPEKHIELNRFLNDHPHSKCCGRRYDKRIQGILFRAKRAKTMGVSRTIFYGQSFAWRRI